jgi:hypothetical protein
MPYLVVHLCPATISATPTQRELLYGSARATLVACSSSFEIMIQSDLEQALLHA